ncbi:MAG: NAD(P)-dependent dehydrogenase (short-subunit alcohol dehydrogenase family) [Paraglaciecola psychrophila]
MSAFSHRYIEALLLNNSMDLTRLRGTVAVVTGAANGGVGWGLAKHAAAIGMHVLLIDLHPKPVKAAQRELAKLYPAIDCIGLCADVTRADSLQQCLREFDHVMGERVIGAVFANAGVIFNHSIMRSTVQEWRSTFEVNVIGAVNTIQALVPRLQQQTSPSIFCTTASVGGLVRGDGGSAAYQASKHALVALTESLSFELARKSSQISVHVLCPCIVESGLAASSVLNARVNSGLSDASEIEPVALSTSELAMSCEQHAQQAFDQLAAGNFYLLTDNVRPYVEHDFPFDGHALMVDRHRSMQSLKLDNSDALRQGPSGLYSTTLKGPMYQELKRRADPVIKK